jgi:hypothetical protein
MKFKIASLIALLLALVITVPMSQGCSALASYLIYEWIQDEFDNDSEPAEEPVIKKIALDRQEIHIGESVLMEVEAEDDDDSAGELEYYWVASAGSLVDPTSRITVWQAPNTAGIVTISILVRDTDDNEDSESFELEVLE